MNAFTYTLAIGNGEYKTGKFGEIAQTMMELKPLEILEGDLTEVNGKIYFQGDVLLVTANEIVDAETNILTGRG